jgi:hypothetical protein
VSTETAFPQVRGTFAYATDCGCDTLSNPECVYVHTESDANLTDSGVPAGPRRGISLSMWALNVLVLCLGLAAVMVWGGTEVSQEEWAGYGSMAVERQVDAEAKAMVAEQVTGLGCATTPRLTDRVAVRNAKGTDTGVVRVVTYNEGMALAKAGKVWLEGYCA